MEQMEQCTIPSVQLNNPCDSIKAIYPTQATLLSSDLLFLVFFAKSHCLVLSAKIPFSGLY